MTLDLLELIFRDKYAHGLTIKECLRAVVKALRDEIEDTYEREGCSWDGAHAYNRFNDILGNAGDSAGGSANTVDGKSAQTTTTPPADAIEKLVKERDEYLQFWKNNAESYDEVRRELDETRAFIEGLEYSDDPETKYGARAFMDKIRAKLEDKP